MRSTFRLLAAVKPARYLKPGTQTGLAGLYTHPSPRSTLLYLYSRTLDALEQIPETSLYRQSVEALTKHRMAIVKAVEPPGHAEWAAQARKVAEANPGAFSVTTPASATRPEDRSTARPVAAGGNVFINHRHRNLEDERYEEWDGEQDVRGTEGLRGADERTEHEKMFDPIAKPDQKIEWTPEPQLTADQIEEIEGKIGAGLIEEVVGRAESELALVDIMKKNKVWEDLEEKPAEGQWTYFER
ncbi:ETC complex I subunit conserved region-domain-containing protein [Jackrogersella minutella]|nr:ETC complex I subunit conserved region-domain-containing protein [Jackrogersella minutella]